MQCTVPLAPIDLFHAVLVLLPSTRTERVKREDDLGQREKVEEVKHNLRRFRNSVGEFWVVDTNELTVKISWYDYAGYTMYRMVSTIRERNPDAFAKSKYIERENRESVVPDVGFVYSTVLQCMNEIEKRGAATNAAAAPRRTYRVTRR